MLGASSCLLKRFQVSDDVYQHVLANITSTLYRTKAARNCKRHRLVIILFVGSIHGPFTFASTNIPRVMSTKRNLNLVWLRIF